MGRYDFTREARETDEELSEKINKLTGLSDSEIAELLPKRADQEQLKSLIDAVNKATDLNSKKTILYQRLAAVTPFVKKAVEGIIKIVV